MPRAPSLTWAAAPRPSGLADGWVIGLIVVIALYAGQALFIPLSIAILLTFVLTPPVLLFRRWGVPRAAAILLVFAGFIATVAGVGTIMTRQIASLVEDLPTYEYTLKQKINTLRKAGVASSSMNRAGDTLKELREEIEQSTEAAAPDANTTATTRPVSPTIIPSPDGAPILVEIREPAPTPLQQIKVVLEVLLSPFATTAAVLLFLVFILFEREDMRDRAIRLLGTSNLEGSTTALNETATRLSNYLSTLTLLNIGYGCFIAVGLWIIGVPSPILWGTLAALMRFVPFIGSLIAAILPLLLAAGVDQGWTMAGLTLGLYVLTEPLMGHVVEPAIQGRVTGLSPMAILVATAFWTLMWGPIGLLLAVPLTLVLVAVGRHLEPLSFINFLLGDQPALTAPEKFYQRILSGNADEAAEQGAVRLQEIPLPQYFDEVVREAIGFAARDAEEDHFNDDRLQVLNKGFKDAFELLEELADDAEAKAASVASLADAPLVVCVGARTPIDDAGAHAMAFLLRKDGMRAEVVAPRDWRDIAMLSPAVIYLGAFSSRRRLNLAYKLIQHVKPGTPIVVAWLRDSDDSAAERTAGVKAVSTFKDAIEECKLVSLNPQSGSVAA